MLSELFVSRWFDILPPTAFTVDSQSVFFKNKYLYLRHLKSKSPLAIINASFCSPQMCLFFWDTMAYIK